MRFLLTLGILLQGYFVVLSSQAAGAPACDANQCASFFYLATCKFPNSAKDSQYLYQQTVVGASPCDTEYTKKYCKCGPLVDPQATSGGGGATSGGGDASGGGATGGGTSSGGNSASGGGTTGGTGTSGSPTTSPNAGKVGPVQYCNSNENRCDPTLQCAKCIPEGTLSGPDDRIFVCVDPRGAPADAFCDGEYECDCVPGGAVGGTGATGGA